jgi:hypothetical protein
LKKVDGTQATTPAVSIGMQCKVGIPQSKQINTKKYMRLHCCNAKKMPNANVTASKGGLSPEYEKAREKLEIRALLRKKKVGLKVSS